MPNLLLINPNTTEATTDKVARLLSPLLPKTVRLHARTAQFGASYISCEASHAVAGHALLDTWAEFVGETAAPTLDGVLIACFGDPGLFALRESSTCSVTGLAEASMIEASATGGFAIVTGGVRWKPMLERLAMSLGFSAQLKHIEIVTPTGAELMADPEMALACLAKACQKATEMQGVQTVILGGAGLAGYAAQIQSQVSKPIIDSVEAGARVVLSNACPKPRTTTNGFCAQWVGMPKAMQALGTL